MTKHSDHDDRVSPFNPPPDGQTFEKGRRLDHPHDHGNEVKEVISGRRHADVGEVAVAVVGDPNPGDSTEVVKAEKHVDKTPPKHADKEAEKAELKSDAEAKSHPGKKSK